jgi:hypothetical protein
MKYFIYFLGIIFITLACNRITKTYYDTGELKGVCRKINDSVYFAKYYYKNGQLKEEGYYTTIEDGDIANGFHKYFYSDGTLKYQGNFIYGYPEYILEKKPIEYYNKLNRRIVSKNGSNFIKIGEPWSFRIILTDCCPMHYAVTDENCNLLNDGDWDDLFDNDFPYTILITQEDYDSCLAGKESRCYKSLGCNVAQIIVNLPDTAGNVVIPTPLALSFVVPIKKE